MGEEMDVEALQAQIDLSNSVALDIVSSWMKPAASSSTESASHAIATQLEEYARRPPRLGLGATVPKSSLATSNEAARLKGKLTGRKRTRDESGGYSAPGAGDDATSHDGDNENESRSAVISTKKIQVNGVRGLGFGDRKKDKGKGDPIQDFRSCARGTTMAVNGENDDLKGKRQKNHHEHAERSQDGPVANAESVLITKNPFVLPDVPSTPIFGDQSVINLVSPAPAHPISSATALSSSKKRKKKHKKKAGHEKQADASVAEDEEWTGFSNDLRDNLESVDNPEGTLSGLLQSDEAGVMQSMPPRLHKGAPKSLPLTPSSVIDLTSPPQPTPFPSRHSTQENPSESSRPVSLFNMRGSHYNDAKIGNSEDQLRETVETPRKKKPRRRRGKGRKNGGHGDKAE